MPLRFAIPQIRQVYTLHLLTGTYSRHTRKLTFSVTKHPGSLLYTFFSGPTPSQYWNSDAPPKGVSNRNAAFNWLTSHVTLEGKDKGVLYIADDDNTYDLELFNEVFSELK